MRRFICVSVALLGAAVAAAPASAAVTIGSDNVVDTSGGGTGCGPSRTHIQAASPANEYAAPFDGVITSWLSGTDQWDKATLKVARIGAGGAITVLHQDGPRFSNGIANPVRFPVRLGDVLGVHFLGGCPGAGSYPGYTARVNAGNVLPGPGTFPDTWQTYKIPVTAQLERDADGDGFGDETQDLCATDASTQGVCPPDVAPPDTSITKGPKKKTKSKSATFEFSSTEPGSTFECSLDGAAFAPCVSPAIVKVRKTGKHNFLVRARDAAGNLDTTEASWSWKRVKKKPKKK